MCAGVVKTTIALLSIFPQHVCRVSFCSSKAAQATQDYLEEMSLTLCPSDVLASLHTEFLRQDDACWLGLSVLVEFVTLTVQGLDQEPGQHVGDAALCRYFQPLSDKKS